MTLRLIHSRFPSGDGWRDPVVPQQRHLAADVQYALPELTRHLPLLLGERAHVAAAWAGLSKDTVVTRRTVKQLGQRAG